MKKIKGYLSLTRPTTSLMIGFAVLAGAVIGAGSEIVNYILPVFIAFLTATFFGMGGNTINDYLDYENDRISHPERPIPSGIVSRKSALVLSFFLFMLSIILGLYLLYLCGLKPLIIVLFALLNQIIYEKKLKYNKIIGNYIIGVQTALAFLFGGVVVNSILPTTIFGIMVFLSISGREIVKDIEDFAGDFNKRTLPKMIGIRNAGIVASFLLIIAVILSPIPYAIGIFKRPYLFSIAVANLILLYSIPTIFKNPKRARKQIKFGMFVGLLAFFVGSLV